MRARRAMSVELRAERRGGPRCGPYMTRAHRHSAVPPIYPPALPELSSGRAARFAGFADFLGKARKRFLEIQWRATERGAGSCFVAVGSGQWTVGRARVRGLRRRLCLSTDTPPGVSSDAAN